MKKVVLGFVAVGGAIGLAVAGRRIAHELREHSEQMKAHCKQMAAHCKQMAAEPGEREAPSERTAEKSSKRPRAKTLAPTM